MKHKYKHHAPSGVKTQVWSPLQLIFHQIDRLKWWHECWGKAQKSNPASYRLLANINHNLQLAIWAAQNPSKAHTIWTHPEPVEYYTNSLAHLGKTEPLVFKTLGANKHPKEYYPS